MSMTAAILAGGLATRLGSLTQQVPKSLIDIAGSPFAEHQIALLSRHGIRKVVFCVGHFGDQIEAVLGDGSRFGMSIEYSYDGAKLLGTGGALRRALPLLGDAFFVLYGDSYLDCEYQSIEQAFWESGKSGLMTVYRNEGRWDSSNVLFREGCILLYDKKNRTPAMQHIDYGLGVLSADSLYEYQENSYFDLEKVYQSLLQRNLLEGYEVTKRFYEIGSVAGINELRALLSGRCGTS
jgi:N-acetyl-alpha-D-muramate 1-phosphate uridylyltransferase